MRIRDVTIVGASVAIFALAGIAVMYQYSWPDFSAGEPAQMDQQRDEHKSGFTSNGERIYFAARSSSGEPVTAAGGPPWFVMHGGSCAECHGPSGTGGVRAPMTSEVAPDIRYSVLTAPSRGRVGDSNRVGYTRESLARAIRFGIDPIGNHLSEAMPRWRISEQDMDDLVDYLRALDGANHE